MAIEFLGPLFSGLALSWGIYTFWTKRAQEKAYEEKQAIHATIRFSQAATEKELNEIKLEIRRQKEEFETLKLSVVTALSQSRTQSEIMNSSFQRIEKTLDRHEEKIDNFGRVIFK